MTFVEEFRAAMRGHGLDWGGTITADGKIHRFKPEGSKSDTGWYVLFDRGPTPGGAYGDWSKQLSEKWHLKNGESPRGKDLAELQKQWKAAEEQRAKDERERHERLAKKAAEYVKTCSRPAKDHLYLQTKQVNIFGAVVEDQDSNLVLPLVDAGGKVWSYQTIDPLGDKLFMPGGRVAGCFFWIDDRQDGPLIICEGYATGATIYEATGWPTCCAMNCGNLLPVAAALRKQFPQRTIIIAADNDRFTRRGDEPYNPGVEKAQEAVNAVKGLLVVPTFLTGDGTDFNDLSVTSGLNAVREHFNQVTDAGMGHRLTIAALLDFIPAEDRDSMLGDRFLCRGGSCLVVGQTHAGKSSFGMQAAIDFALGQDFFGIKPRRALKSLIVQAENDDGDTAEMLQGILLGTGRCDTGTNQAAVAKKLDQNLIIYRDQTHVGRDFPAYAKKLVELHKPDLFWIDPFLSFYGADVNDQESMSAFLRRDLNPISERSGLIWMVMHHTGKPSKDQRKVQSGWSAQDFAYTAVGSSELSNWARAIVTINHVHEGEFRVVLAKRGWRAGVKDEKGAPASELYLRHHAEHICWQRIPKPDDEKTDLALAGFVQSVGNNPMKATDLMRLAEKCLQRSIRTCWSLWDGGDGPLGLLFTRDGDKWIPRSSQVGLPYKED